MNNINANLQSNYICTAEWQYKFNLESVYICTAIRLSHDIGLRTSYHLAQFYAMSVLKRNIFYICNLKYFWCNTIKVSRRDRVEYFIKHLLVIVPHIIIQKLYIILLSQMYYYLSHANKLSQDSYLTSDL